MDADIAGAFDTIDHTYLLKAIGKVPGSSLIHQWLKAGYVDGGVFHDTDAGTPQGGVISPLLANIALHGMETALGVKRSSQGESVARVQWCATQMTSWCSARAGRTPRASSKP